MTPLLGEALPRDSVSNIPFEVPIVVSSSDARLVGIVSSEEGGGADSPYIEMVKGDDTFGGGTGEVRGRAFVVTMVSAPAVSAGARVRTVATVVPWVLAVALKAVWVRRKALFPFAQQ